MGIEQKFTEPLGIITAFTLAAGMTFTPCNCREPQRTRHETAEQMQMRPDRVPARGIEGSIPVFYDGPTISEYRSDRHDVEIPAIPAKTKDWRFYDNKAIIPSSMRTTAEKALRRMPEPDPQPRDDNYNQSRTAMLMYARSGHRR